MADPEGNLINLHKRRCRLANWLAHISCADVFRGYQTVLQLALDKRLARHMVWLRETSNENFWWITDETF